MTWYLKVQLIPNARIVRDQTFVQLPDGRKVDPGTYTIKKGSTIVFQAVIRNEGDEGTCKVEIYDKKNAVSIASWRGTLSAGATKTVSKTITFDRDMEVVVYASSIVAGRWALTDTYG